MYTKKTNVFVLAVLLLLPVWLCLLTVPSEAGATIAKVKSFTGDVIIQSGEEITKLKQVNHVLNNGDYIMTKQGEAEVIFDDGAVMKLNPFSKTMVQEREEESGVWLFKTKKAARRVTVFVGKLWFKSGVSDKRNFLQTPTAVCGLRGSDGDFGFNPTTLQTFLNMYSGEAAVVGSVIKGFFDNPGASAAQKSAVYQALAKAYEKTVQAQTSGKVIDQAQAKVEALQVAVEAASSLQANPDATVKNEAAVAAATASASLAAASATVTVEQLKEVKNQAADEAAASKATQALAQAERG